MTVSSAHTADNESEPLVRCHCFWPFSLFFCDAIFANEARAKWCCCWWYGSSAAIMLIATCPLICFLLQKLTIFVPNFLMALLRVFSNAFSCCANCRLPENIHSTYTHTHAHIRKQRKLTERNKAWSNGVISSNARLLMCAQTFNNSRNLLLSFFYIPFFVVHCLLFWPLCSSGAGVLSQWAAQQSHRLLGFQLRQDASFSVSRLPDSYGDGWTAQQIRSDG